MTGLVAGMMGQYVTNAIWFSKWINWCLTSPLNMPSAVSNPQSSSSSLNPHLSNPHLIFT
jgi:hypothetical protein